MILRTQFLSKIRALGFSYKRQQKHSELYRKAGTTGYVNLSRNANLDPLYVSRTLLYAGLDQSAIDAFIAEFSVEENNEK